MRRKRLWMCPNTSFCSFHVFCVPGPALVFLPTENLELFSADFGKERKKKKKNFYVSSVSKI